MTHGNTLYYIVPHLHHGWPTSTSYLFLTDGVTVPSPSPFTYTRQPISHAKQPAWLPVSLRLGRGMFAVQPSFGERPSQKYIGWAFPYPAQNIYGGDAPFPIPIYGNLPIPYLGEAVELQPSFWGEALPKIHKVGLSIPRPKYIGGAHPSLSQPMAICRSPTLGKPWSHCPSPLTLWGPKLKHG